MADPTRFTIESCKSCSDVKVFLYGQRVQHAIEVDTAQGWIIAAIPNWDGNLFITDEGKVTTAKMTGRVAISFIDENGDPQPYGDARQPKYRMGRNG